MKCNDIEKEKERRDKISKKMKENFKNGVIKGWAHINESKSRRSYPEEFFLKVFEKNELLYKYTIVEKFPYGRYVIDFLLVELKIIIEIDGEQHYKTKKAIEHDKKRDEYFLNEGFKVYRVRWIDVFKNTKNEIDELMNFIVNNNSSFRKYTLDEISISKKKKIRKKNKNKKCGNCENLILITSNLCRECWKKSLKNKEKKIKIKKKRIIKKNRICIECNQEIYGDKLCNKCNGLKNRKVIDRPDYDILLNDLDKMSLSAVGRKYGVTHNAVKKWIKNYEKCKM